MYIFIISYYIYILIYVYEHDIYCGKISKRNPRCYPTSWKCQRLNSSVWFFWCRLVFTSHVCCLLLISRALWLATMGGHCSMQGTRADLHPWWSQKSQNIPIWCSKKAPNKKQNYQLLLDDQLPEDWLLISLAQELALKGPFWVLIPYIYIHIYFHVLNHLELLQPTLHIKKVLLAVACPFATRFKHRVWLSDRKWWCRPVPILDGFACLAVGSNPSLVEPMMQDWIYSFFQHHNSWLRISVDLLAFDL